MKRPDQQTMPASKSTGQKLRMLVALGAIAVAGAGGYKCGRDSLAERIQKLEADSASKDRRITDTENNLEQARQIVESLSQIQRMTVTKLLETEEKIAHPDEEMCIDVIDKAISERVSQLASILGLTNQRDIDALKSVMRKGYTQIENVFGDGTGITLVDPNAKEGTPNRYTSITLEEPIKNVPDEYLSESDKVPKSQLELELDQKIADGKGEEVIRNFDVESVRPASEDPNSVDNQMYKAFVDLQSKFSKTTDPATRKELFCRFFGQLMKADIEASKSGKVSETVLTAPTPENVRKQRLRELHMKAMLELVGMQDEEECISYILENQ